MIRNEPIVCLTAIALVFFALGASAAQQIVCWKDASGKVIGCGDKIPPEYAGSATKELDKEGNVRKTNESAEEATKRKVQEKEQTLAKAEEKKRMVEQKRQDDALLNTFSNEKEIDLKRDRELRALDNFITQQNAALKSANERMVEIRKRAEIYEKDKKPLPPVIKEDLARAEREKARVEGEIAANEKAKTDTTANYAEYRRRFMELKGVAPVAAPATTVTPVAPATAKK